jgi:CheY-specific phosphatase CheX
MVRCPLTLAYVLTTAMFQGDEEATLVEVRDALGELTNMVAGNVKALLPGPSTLSLPTVAFGSQYEISVLGSQVIGTVSFVSGCHPLVVSVVQRSDEVPQRDG